MTSRREEPGTWRGATGAGGFCETETGAATAGAALDSDDADAETSREKTMRLGLRGGDFVPILVVAVAVESRAALLLNGSICFLVELLDVGERL